jgi:hypothetical protein
MSVVAEALGDKIGPNDHGAANMAWQLAATLRANAERTRVTPPGVGGEPTPPDRPPMRTTPW